MNSDMNQAATGQEQQLRQLNDKLLHKYVSAHIKEVWTSVLLGRIALFIILVICGISANIYLDLQWPVIIAFLLFTLAGIASCLFFETKIKDFHDPSIPIMTIKHELQQYATYLKIRLLALLVILPTLFVWLAFELREVLTTSFLSIDIDTDIADIVFFVTIAIGIILPLIYFYEHLMEILTINKLVKDIDTYDANNIK